MSTYYVLDMGRMAQIPKGTNGVLVPVESPAADTYVESKESSKLSSGLAPATPHGPS